MKKLIISPQAGFGNRLRALCSAKLLGSLLDRQVFHYWINDDELSHVAHVDEMKRIDPSYMFDLDIPLFDGQHVDACFTEWMPGDYWHREQSTAQTKLSCGQTIKLGDIGEIIRCQLDTILVETSLILRPENFGELWKAMMTATYKKHFRLNSRWSAIYENTPCFDFGVSIRRGNFLAYHPAADVGAHAIAGKIKDRKGSKIVFSDDKAYQAELRALLSSPFGIIESETGIDSYIGQFLTLSKCKTVIGTEGSSFPEQASLFGGVPFEPI